MNEQPMQPMPDYGAQSRKLHRRLVPANIVILILSVVALVTLLCGSMVSVRIHITGDFVSQMMETVMEEEQSSGENGNTGDESAAGITQEETNADGSGDASGAGSENEQMKEMLQYVFRNVDYTLKLEVNPVQMFRAGMGDNEAVRAYITEVIGGALSSLEELIMQVMPDFLSVAVATMVENLGVEELENVDTQQIEQVVTLLSENKTEEAKTQFPALAQQFASEQLGVELTADQLSQVSEFFNEMVDSGTQDDGTFSFYGVINAMAGGSGEGSGESGEDSTGSSENPLDAIFSFADELDDETLSTMKTVFIAVSAAGVGLAALCWAFLALFSFIHIFTKNKKVGMWYVKLFGFLPCLLFFVVPTVALLVLPGMMGGDASSAFSMISALGPSFFGTVAVSGICYLLLWLVSIFWCFPIKRKIRKLKKLGA